MRSSELFGLRTLCWVLLDVVLDVCLCATFEKFCFLLIRWIESE
jgi:hypothetical protein